MTSRTLTDSDRLTVLRQQAVEIFQAGIAAANPDHAIKSCLSVIDGQLHISLNSRTGDTTPQRTAPWTAVQLIAFGKAACQMTASALEIIPAHLLKKPALVITNYENSCELLGSQVIGAGHPLPDDNGLHASTKIIQQVQQTRSGELVLALISGGGSALLPAPVAGIDLQDKIATTQLLLASGATINQINCVRKHLSRLKGGGLAQLAYPADVHALVLSDVPGDDISSIASGPTVADDSTFADAITILQSFQIWQRTPVTVREYLLQGAAGSQPETPDSQATCLKKSAYTLIGSNSLSVDAAVQTGTKLGYKVEIYDRHLHGEAQQVAEQFATYAKNRQSTIRSQPLAIIAGGETTVTLPHNSKGKGGRNQEMALAFALAAERHHLVGNWTFLSAGTDGRDGPTEAAGGIVNVHTLTQIRRVGLGPATLLRCHDSYSALKAVNDLLITGATGTNVADLQILLIG